MPPRKKKKINSLVLEKLLNSPESVSKHLGRLLMTRKSQAIKHLEEQEELISSVFEKCAWLIILTLKSKKFREKIISTPGSAQKNKWTTFLDNVSFCQDQNIQAMNLFRTLLQELISREKDYTPFWTPAYKEISEKLSSHIETDSVVSGSTLLNSSLPKQVEKLQSLEITRQKLQNKNLPMTSYQLSTSLAADSLEEDLIKKTNFKTVKIQLFPTLLQKTHLKKTFDVYRYVKNKTVEQTEKKGHTNSWMSLRNLLVTEDTKTTSDEYNFFSRMIKTSKDQEKKLLKTENKESDLSIILESEKHDCVWIKYSKKIQLKNVVSEKTKVKDFELEIDKDIRTCAVKTFCANKKTTRTLFEKGTIKWYKMSFKKKSDPNQEIKLTSRLVKIESGEVLINLGKVQECKSFDKYKMSYKNKKKYKNLEIKHDVSITFKKGTYFLNIPVDISIKKIIPENIINFCGVDPGVRSLLTVYGNNGVVEYKHDRTLLVKLYDKIKFLKSKKHKYKKKLRKKQLNKIEKKIKDFVDNLHWITINHLVKENDIIYFGDIKSHGIVKDGKNSTLNRDMNSLKFYQYKQRLRFKAIRAGKRVIMINEYLTTQGCSKCGTLWPDIGKSKTYYCQNKKCRVVYDRDINSAKNICMKGMLRV